MRKRVVSLLLAVCMVLSLVPVTAFAEDGTTASTPFTLQVSSDGEKVTLPLTKEDRKVTFTAETFGADALGFAPAQGDTADTAYSAVYPQGSKAVVFTAESGFSVWTAEGDYLDGTGLGGGSAAILLQETEYYVLGDVGEGCYYALYLNEEKAVEQGPDLADGYYQLASADDLTWFAEQVSGGETGIKGQLTADIDMSEVTGFTGIGTEANAFAGELDGNGKTVTVKINEAWNGVKAGLVAYTAGAYIHDVTLDGVVAAYKGAGMVACALSSETATRIEDCVNKAAMNGSEPVGGILGEAKGQVSIRGCVNEGDLGPSSQTGSTTGSSGYGGIVGRIAAADCLIEDCENSGNTLTVSIGTGIANAGGLVGYASSSTNCTVKNCFNTGTISSNAPMGGIVGKAGTGMTIESCYNTGKIDCRFVSSYSNGAGGILGDTDYNKGVVVKNVYNVGEIVGAGRCASGGLGGIVGLVRSTATVENAYNAGTVTVAGSASHGSILGWTYDTTSKLVNCYWLTGTDSAMQSSAYASAAVSGGSEEAKSEADMSTEDFLAALGDGFKLDKGISDFPVLSWQKNNCEHTDVEILYTSNEDGTHAAATTCKKCSTVINTETEDCADTDGDGECDKCGYVLSVPEVSKITLKDEAGNSYPDWGQYRLVTLHADDKVAPTIQLTLEVAPEEAQSSVTWKDVTWTNRSENVATVDENGLITVQGIGFVCLDATITKADNSEVKTSYRLLVIPDTHPVVSIYHDGKVIASSNQTEIPTIHVKKNETYVVCIKDATEPASFTWMGKDCPYYVNWADDDEALEIGYFSVYPDWKADANREYKVEWMLKAQVGDKFLANAAVEGLEEYGAKVWVEMVSDDYVEPTGPDLADGYYQLASADDLTWFAEQVSGGETTIKGKLTAGIDMSEVTGFTGIGTEANAFAGELDGNGKTVTVKMNVEGNFGTNNRAGLVAFADGAEIHDVTMAGDIEAYNGAGLVGCTIGDGETVIKNCVNQAAMRGSNPVGGILGEAKGKVTIRGCVNEGVLGFASFEGTSDSGNNGGIVGRITAADCLIEGCENSGEMLTAGAAGGAVRVGGIVGSVTGKNCVVKQCFNTGKIAANNHVGGIVGEAGFGAGLTIESCYNTGSVQGEAFNSGQQGAAGILGTAYGVDSILVQNVYNTGKITGRGSGQYSGVGGIVGYSYKKLNLTNAYNAGQISCSSSISHGSVLGCVLDTSNKMTNCHWLEGTDTQMQSGVSKTLEGGIDAETAAQMQSAAFVSTLGDGFKKDAGMVNGGYPVLSWQKSEAKDYIESFWLNDLKGEPLTVGEDGAYTYAAPDYLTALNAKATLKSTAPEGAWVQLVYVNGNTNKDVIKTISTANGAYCTALMDWGMESASAQLQVVADGGKVLQSVPVTLTRVPTLSALSLEETSLTKSFTAGNLEYTTYAVLGDTATVNAKPYAGDNSGATYTVTYNGTDSNKIALEMGENTITVTVTAAGVSQNYTVKVTRTAPVQVTFALNPANAIVNLLDGQGQRVEPDNTGAYTIKGGEDYTYTVTLNGYVAQTGKLNRTETGEVEVTLVKAPDSTLTNLPAEWPNFRNGDNHLGITTAKTPYDPEDTDLLWAAKYGTGWAAAPGSPILVDDCIVTYNSTYIRKLNKDTGALVAEGTMVASSSYSIVPATYADGMIFVGLSGGRIQCFNAETLESLWVYTDALKGQPNCPITYKNGYVYAGFWQGEDGVHNFACISTADEDPTQTTEAKLATWTYSRAGGFYWAGAYASENGKYIVVGTDNGVGDYTTEGASLLVFESLSGKLVDHWDGIRGDIRSNVSYDPDSDRVFFTSKGGVLCNAKVNWETGAISDKHTTVIKDSKGNEYAMSTCTPSVYNGRVYIGVSGTSQFGANSGHGIAVYTLEDSGEMTQAYVYDIVGYPQTSAMVSVGYVTDEDDSVYIYLPYNYTPGGISVLKDKPGQTKPVTTTGTGYSEVFTPKSPLAQYCICSTIADSTGTIYYKNDSCYMMAISSKLMSLSASDDFAFNVEKDGTVTVTRGQVVANLKNGLTRDVSNYLTWDAAKNELVYTYGFDSANYGRKELRLSVADAAPYTVTLTPEKDEVDCGETVQIDLVVTSRTGGTYNSADVTMSYDKDLFDFVTPPTSANGPIVTKNDDGTIRIRNVGNDRASGKALITLSFVAKTVTEIKTGDFQITSAVVDNGKGSMTGDAPLAAIQNCQVKIVPQFDVTFLTRDGGKHAVIRVKYDSTVEDVPAAPEVFYHTFAGWKDGETVYTAEQIAARKVTAAVTYQAAYTANSYTISHPGVDGADEVTYGRDYVGTIQGFDGDNYDYTLSYTVTDEETKEKTEYTASCDDQGSFTIPGSNIKGDVTITVSRVIKGVTIELFEDYVGGYTQIVVKGNASAYAYNGSAMFKTPAYADNAYAWIVEGHATVEGVKALLTVVPKPQAVIPASDYDVNKSRKVDINDAQAVYNMYNITVEYPVANYMELYLRADVDGDHKVNASDLNAVLGQF